MQTVLKIQCVSSVCTLHTVIASRRCRRSVFIFVLFYAIKLIRTRIEAEKSSLSYTKFGFGLRKPGREICKQRWYLANSQLHLAVKYKVAVSVCVCAYAWCNYTVIIYWYAQMAHM